MAGGDPALSHGIGLSIALQGHVGARAETHRHQRVQHRKANLLQRHFPPNRRNELHLQARPGRQAVPARIRQVGQQGLPAAAHRELLQPLQEQNLLRAALHQSAGAELHSVPRQNHGGARGAAQRLLHDQGPGAGDHQRRVRGRRPILHGGVREGGRCELPGGAFEDEARLLPAAIHRPHAQGPQHGLSQCLLAPRRPQFRVHLVRARRALALLRAPSPRRGRAPRPRRRPAQGQPHSPLRRRLRAARHRQLRRRLELAN
ncbi:hypothetical protein Mp_5g06950 [Marchantia polymorpha subsp. ruderalis]|uniref:Uncharacterized protein n=2 Tax=Marchantia polymorpha TaxID=3197 RepID=A0AAF6BFR8_MARPO|nr:hypothetical protein MARPO_0136s0027 [Marchantia polymorpha]BBN10852.1 hypothetical protein Mp_5g06950 [Marchantia polymorpha subsp. ruderalis]|eukprot:PTQ29699.1 hypothetical protein MARPO_0136s0027 [Marchantia polymorpha]